MPEVEAGDVHAAVGGRLGVKPFGRADCDCSFELGGSASRSFGPAGTELTLLGADLSAGVAGLDARSEVIQLRSDDGPRLTGAYTQAMYMLDPVFFGGRYFPQGELRIAYERDFEQRSKSFFVQIVGGSNWKPTGLRR